MPSSRRSGRCVSSLWAILWLIVGGTNVSVARAFTTSSSLLSSTSSSSFASAVTVGCSSRLAMMTTRHSSTPPHQRTTTTFINSIREMANDYDVFLLDMWGVMHDGSRPYDGVLECVKELKRNGKELIVLSNSSKRTDSSVRNLKKLGFDPSDFSQIITSGEISYRMLSGEDENNNLDCDDTWSVLTKIREQSKSNKVFVFGSGNEDEEYCTACGWTLAPLEEADLLLARGTFTICNGNSLVQKETDEEEYLRVLDESLQEAATRKIPMLVSNPDKVRPDEGLPPMPGAIGDAYEALLGGDAERLVKRIGKPFPEVFQIALRGKDRSRACMIGDALETDVTGGSAMGLTTVWCINDGIHGPDAEKEVSLEAGATAVLDAFNETDGTYAKRRVLQPTFVVPHFRW